MSAHQLAVTKPSQCHLTIPIHISFSPKNDITVLLWETGYAEALNLQTRLGPGRGPVADPLKLWSGSVALESSSGGYRQVVQWAEDTDTGDVVRFAALSSSYAKETLAIVELQGATVREQYTVVLPGLNGRLLRSTKTLSWQAHDGQVYDCKLSSPYSCPSR